MSIDLKHIHLFIDLDAAQLNRLESRCERRSFGAGENIFKEGDPGDGIYFVAEGEVAINVRMPSQQTRQLARVGNGDFFGEMAVLDDGARSAAVNALVDTKLIFVPREMIMSLFSESSAFSLRLFRETSARLREFNHKFVEESLQSERLSLVGRFARSIVHDFKNPLHVINLVSECSVFNGGEEKARKDTHQLIHQQVQRMSDMINELLEFSRGGPSELVLSKHPYRDFIKETIEEIGAETESRRVRLILSDEVPDVEVNLDPRRLKRVFHNLIANALDAMTEGGIITWTVRQTGDSLETDIEDSGSGIHPDIASRIFDAFATHGKKQGTGLGLSISKKIVQDHRGDIRVVPNPGKGALFRIILPL
jgi:signal transduction histidine kinase